MRIRLSIIILVVFALGLSGNNLEFYKKGVINLDKDNGFGKNTKWGDLFHRAPLNFVVAKNGSMFIARRLENDVMILDNKGNFINKFGQKGEGPGDLFMPSVSGIIGNKYLLIKDDAVRKRFSLFDFKGNFIKVIRTSRVPLFVSPVSGNRMLYTSVCKTREESSIMLNLDMILKDLSNKTGKIVNRISYRNVNLKIGSYRILLSHHASGFCSVTVHSELICGISDKPELKIYSLEGKLLRIVKLVHKREEIGASYFEDVKKSQRDKVTKSILKKITAQQFVGKQKYFPYYSSIYVDSEDNIILKAFSNDLQSDSIKFFVYSKEGKFICTTKLASKKFVMPESGGLAFCNNSLYVACMVKNNDPDDDEEVFKIVKVDLK